jgi:hypothetical protein
MVEANVVEDPSYFVAIENADWGEEPIVKN